MDLQIMVAASVSRLFTASRKSKARIRSAPPVMVAGRCSSGRSSDGPQARGAQSGESSAYANEAGLSVTAPVEEAMGAVVAFSWIHAGSTAVLDVNGCGRTT